jgi:hypothetical protein
VKITLASGREVWLGALNQRHTYAGVLAGKPDARTNQPVIDELLEDAKRTVAGSTPQLVGSPDVSGRLPAVACIAELQSGGLMREGSEPYSSMSVAWFQDDFALPIAPAIVASIQSLDWEAEAIDWCW